MAFARLIRGVVLAGLLAGPGLAQDLGVTVSPVVTLDVERLLQDTAIGQNIATKLEDQVQALADENASIAADLEAEEQALTENRPDMEVAEFRILADAFDQKVQQIRAEQDAKQQELQRLRDLERDSFLDAIGPLLSAIAREHGAVVVLERRSVFLSAEGIDITGEAIKKIDEALASGDLIQGGPSIVPTDDVPADN